MISESELEISRHRIAVFMSTHMAYELLPESGKVRIYTASSAANIDFLFISFWLIYYISCRLLPSMSTCL